MCVFSHIYQMELSSTLTGALYPLMFPLTLEIKRISESNVKECGALEEVVYLSLGM